MWRTTIGTASGLVALLAPAAALADGDLGAVGGFHYFTSSASMLPHAGLSSAGAVCQPGSGHVVGGGFDADDASVEGMAIESAPLDTGDADHKPDDGWVAGAVDVRSAATNLVSYAVCSNTPVKYASRSKNAQPRRVGKLSASCPPGSKDTAGGMQTGDLNAVQIDSSFPVDDGDKGKTPDDGWQVKFFNRGGRASVTVWAVCAKGTQVSYVDNTAFPIDPGEQQHVEAAVCDDPLHVTGGGVRYSSKLSTIETRMTGVMPLDASFDPGEPPNSESVPDDRMAFEVNNTNPFTGGVLHRWQMCVHE
jgi:hypothetical protein